MNGESRALLLVGSAKPEGASTSESLGGYLLERLAGQGWQTEAILLHRALRTEERTAAMLEAANAADLVILAFPLYVDALPYLATRALELIAEGRTSPPAPSPARGGDETGSDGSSRERGGGETGGERGERFLAIVNCGFPEAAHCDVALEICRQFAAAARFVWAGGLALGAGGAVNGQPLEKVGGMARNVVAALDRAAAALSAGEVVPAEVEALMRQPLMPKRLYLLAGNAGWLMTARKNGALRRLGARPFREA